MKRYIKEYHIILRILCIFVMIVSIISGYWWATWIIAIAFLFIFPNYYEIIIWGIIYDSLYGIPLTAFGNIPYMFTLLSIALFIIAFFSRKYLLAYQD